MAVGIRGIRLESLSVGKDGDSFKVSGQYALISTVDKVLAKQTFNQYGGMDIPASPATVRAMEDLRSSLEADISAHIGLEGVAS